MTTNTAEIATSQGMNAAHICPDEAIGHMETIHELPRPATAAHEGRAKFELVPTSGLPALHVLLSHYTSQLDDAMRLRLAVGNRIGAMGREGIAPEFLEPMGQQADMLLALEKAAKRMVERKMREHPMAGWVKETQGISLYGFARLFGATGPLDRFATVSKLWAYMGLHVSDGEAPRRRKGELAGFSSRKRSTAIQMAEGPIKVGGPYRLIYDAARADYDNRPWCGRCRPAGSNEPREHCTDGHAHARARRLVAKAMLRDMWVEWRQRIG